MLQGITMQYRAEVWNRVAQKFGIGARKMFMLVSPYPDLKMQQDQVHFYRNGKALWLKHTCLIGEPAL